MAECVKISSRDDEEKLNVTTQRERAPLTGAERMARLRIKQRKEAERMKRITTSAEELNAELLKHQGQQITLELDFVSDDAGETLDRLREHIAQTETARETAQAHRKGGRTKHIN